MAQHFEITLEAARIASGYTVKEAAKLSGISERTIRRNEEDCSGILFNTFIALCSTYAVDPGYIYCGRKEDAQTRQRGRAKQIKERLKAKGLSIKSI